MSEQILTTKLSKIILYQPWQILIKTFVGTVGQVSTIHVPMVHILFGMPIQLIAL